MYQQITLIGNLGNKPEMRYTPSGTAVTNFSLAVSRRWTGNDGQQQEKTTWFRVTAWERRAEVASQYLNKGSKVMVIGEVTEARPWTDRDGNQRASIEVLAQEIKFLEGRGQEQDAGAGKTSGAAQPAEAEPADIPF
jgi:single-strand DNA-binding protein